MVNIELFAASIITVVLFMIMIRPKSGRGSYIDLTGLFRVFWLLPIAVVWLIYLAFVR